jgi:type I restriction enzyme S subunit
MKLRKDKWEIARLEDLSQDIEYGITASSDDTGNTVLLRITDINETGRLNDGLRFTTVNEKTYAKYELKQNNVLIARSGATAGKPYIHKSGERFVFASYLLRILLKEDKINPDYFFSFLNSPNYLKQLNGIKIGSAQPNVNTTNLGTLKIPVPPLEEQKQIASLFQSIETSMEYVEGQEKNLMQLKNNLLRDLFSEKQHFGHHLKEKDFETVKFDKVAINISERVEPKKTTLITYVGLEHLDADNLRIERTGTPDDVIGTKLKIYKGDIIFGKRRAYLRKVAVSHFDGIASAHSMILRANEKYIEKDFLPYFMQSDTFMSRAVQISEGSLSPTIKNKTLAQQEFTLPKKEKQKELISIFKQFDLTMDQLKQQKTTLKNLKQKLLDDILG